jgi:hypothetical protein
MGTVMYREVLTFVDRFTALRFTATGALPGARRIRILPMTQYACWPILSELSSYNSLIKGGVENAATLHVNHPRTGRRGSDLLFEAVLREYFFLLLPFGG